MTTFSGFYGKARTIKFQCKVDEKQILKRFRKLVESDSPMALDVEIDKNAQDIGWMFRRAMRYRMKRMKFDFMIPKFEAKFHVANEKTILTFSVDPSKMPVLFIGSLVTTVGLFFGILISAFAGEDELVYILLAPYLLTVGPAVQIMRMTATWQKRAEKLSQSLATLAEGKIIDVQRV